MRLAVLGFALVVAAAGTAAADPAAAKPAPAKPKQAKPAVQKIDLFPRSVLGDPGLGSTGGVAEKGPGLSFGGGWKHDAAMIGALAVGFAALVGLCSGGACMLPDWLPGTPDPGGIDLPSPEPDKRIRPAR